MLATVSSALFTVTLLHVTMRVVIPCMQVRSLIVISVRTYTHFSRDLLGLVSHEIKLRVCPTRSSAGLSSDKIQSWYALNGPATTLTTYYLSLVTTSVCIATLIP